MMDPRLRGTKLAFLDHTTSKYWVDTHMQVCLQNSKSEQLSCTVSEIK